MNNSNTIAIESFITFCDDMMIAEEGFLSKALSKLQTLFAKLILKIDKMVKRMKDNRLKKVLTNLLSRAKRGLSKCKSLNEHNPDMVRELQEEYNEINEEVQEVVKEDMINEVNETKRKVEKEESASTERPSNIEIQGDKTIFYTDSSKTTIKAIKYKSGTVDYYENGVLKFTDYKNNLREQVYDTINYEKDGRTIGMIIYKDGRIAFYKNGVLNCIDYTTCQFETEIKYKYFEKNGETIREIHLKNGKVQHFKNEKPDLGYDPLNGIDI